MRSRRPRGLRCISVWEVSARNGVLALLVATAAVASSPASAVGAAHAHAAGGCAGHLLERVSGGTLTEQIVAHGAGPETELVHLCSSSGGRQFTFPEGPEGYGDSFLFAGLAFAGGETAAVAWSWAFQAPPELWVVSLVTHKILFRKALPRDTANPETFLLGKLVLQRDGSVAWTQSSTSGACEVVEHTSHGTRVLNPTRQAQPASLTLAGTTLRWLEQDGQARTATLR
jgi:hypothetical protein